MKRFLISAAAVALMSTVAAAADLPIYEPVPEVVPVPVAWSWTGFYVGLNGGYAWADKDVSFDYTDDAAGTFDFAGCEAAGVCASGLGYDTDGFLIGGHAGYNWQAGWAVFGLEADIDYTDMEGGASVTAAAPGFVTTTTSASTEYDYFGTFRGRLGAGFDRVLVYGTGGLAFAGVENFASSTDVAGNDFFGSHEETAVGWTAGGGIEFAVTDNVTLGAEALYFDLGDEDVDLSAVGFTPPADVDVDANFENDGVLARGRLSVKFNSLFGG